MNTLQLSDVSPAAWDAFCANSPDAWFRHTNQFIALALTLGEGSRNRSFAVTEGGTLVAVVPLVEQVIAGTNTREYAMGGTPIPYPACAPGLPDKERDPLFSFIMAEIDRSAAEHGVACARMFVDPLTQPILNGTMRANPLPMYGYEDTSMSTVCMGLSLSEEEILAGMSARRRRYIGAAERKGLYRIDFLDRDSITEEIYHAYRELYFETAGKIVGTPERWQTMFEWLRSGSAILVLVRESRSGALIAGHLVMLYQKRGYDTISAIHPSRRNDHEIGPHMQWETMKYLKGRGFTHYEIGWLFPHGISEKVYSPKELAISHFKSLFGGTVLPLFRGKKYYDKEYMKQEKIALAQAYAERTSQTP